MVFWHRIVIAAVLFAGVWVLSRVIDWWLARRTVPPEAMTRYRVLRRAISVSILFIGLLSALLVIPGVRAIAGGLLASSAVLGVIIGLASQRTLANFIAGILLAVTQPIRLGDRVSYGGIDGVVEEIGLTYTFIRMGDGARLVVPNDKLASETIVNASIRNRETFAEIIVQLPLTCDLDEAVGALREEVAEERKPDVVVTDIAGSATMRVRAAAPDAAAARRLETELRLRVHKRLRALGAFG
jgi:small-conductance mechanosensitive channel